MRAVFAVAVVLSLGLMMSAPAALAFHGTPYVLNGTGSFAGLPVGIFNARLEWGGNGIFRLSIVLPATNTPLVSAVIQGGESLPAGFLAVAGCAFLERVEPYRAIGPGFQASGVQDNCLSNGQRYMRVTGTYQNAWSFDVKTGAPFG